MVRPKPKYEHFDFGLTIIMSRLILCTTLLNCGLCTAARYSAFVIIPVARPNSIACFAE